MRFFECLTVLTLLLAGTGLPAFSLSQGQVVQCNPTGSTGDIRQGTVIEDNPRMPYVRIQCGPAQNGNPGGIFLVARENIQTNAGQNPANQNATPTATTAAGNQPTNGAGGLAAGQSVMCMPTLSEKDWRLAEIIENNAAYDYIRVKAGPSQDGRPGGIFLVSRKDVRPPDFRPHQQQPVQAAAPAVTSPAGNQTAPPQQAQTPSAFNNPNQQVPPAQNAANPKCACQPSNFANAGGLEGTFKAKIAARHMYLDGRALDAGQNPATVSFQSFSYSGPRPYQMPDGLLNKGSPDGPGGRMGTQVYDVTTNYIYCVDYPAGNPTGPYKGRIELTKFVATYKCFIDSLGAWRCNQGPNTSFEMESINK